MSKSQKIFKRKWPYNITMKQDYSIQVFRSVVCCYHFSLDLGRTYGKSKFWPLSPGKVQDQQLLAHKLTSGVYVIHLN